ncbi:Rho- GTP-binding protein RhoN [Mortierella claussenii]|nr:Rho- GTP-binding protein RhoN [Mortierella claussenii]
MTKRMLECRKTYVTAGQGHGVLAATRLPRWSSTTHSRSYSTKHMQTTPVAPNHATAVVSAPYIIQYPLRPPSAFQAFVKPVLFTAVASFGAFATAAYIWERDQVTLIKRIQAWRSRAKGERPTAREFAQAQAEILKERWMVVLDRFHWIQDIGIPIEVQKALFMMRSRWMELSPGERTIWSIIGLNSIVFAAWQVPRLNPFMQKWFMHHPASGRSITLLTSMFSHQHFWHFGLNMFALHSFALPLHDAMGREQFLAFYLTTGITASLASHLFTVARVPWSKIIPSLGASGALFGCVSSTAYMYPDATVYIIFLPFLPIKIPVALGAMMGLDLVGIIKNWKVLDHYAHLAGSTFGLAYMYAGKNLIWTPLQEKAIELNKDSNLFGKLSPKSSTTTSSTPPHSSLGSVIEVTKNSSGTSSDERSAKEIAQARMDKVKSWWDAKRGGGNRE